MKKKILIASSLLTVLFAFCLAQAGVTMYGQQGLLRVHSARSCCQGLLTVNLHNEGRYEKDVYIPIDRPDATGKAYYLTTHIGLTYGITDFLEVSGATLFLSDVGRQTWPRKQYKDSEGIGDTQLGLKLSYPGELSEFIHFGLQGFVVLPTGSSDQGVVGVRKGFFTRDETYGGGRLLVDLNFEKFGCYLNGGYVAVNEDSLFPGMFGPASNQFIFGGGVEYEAGPKVIIFAEITGEHTDADFLEEKMALRVTPGVRLFGPAIPLDVAVDFRLSPEESGQPDWNVILGFSVGSMLRPTTGILFGKVIDEETGEPISAVVSFPGTMVQNISTDQLSGAFEVTLSPSEYTVLASNPDYYSQTKKAVLIRAGKRTQLDLALKARPKEGKITGKIVDKRTNEPISATLTFPEIAVESVKAVPATGMYEVTLPEGTVVVRVECEGYLTLSEPVVIKRDETEVKNFSLEPQIVPMGKLTGQMTDIASDSVLVGLVTFIDTDIPSVRTDQEGIYSVEVSPATYRVKAVVNGYVEKMVPVVIEDGKTTLQNFALRRIPKKGEVIRLRGITFEFNKSTIRPGSYPILDDAAQTMIEIPELKVQIEGHTDSKGSDEYNQKLSEARANSVRNYLITRHQINPNRIVAVGFGERRPVADNDTEEGRQLNRRIDFVILESR
ncbi:MAG: OmpA family protein [Gemmatimonadota bacterium]|nr:MAG: OmpA family protein [Gemmatimonadota bacterium]